MSTSPDGSSPFQQTVQALISRNSGSGGALPIPVMQQLDGGAPAAAAAAPNNPQAAIAPAQAEPSMDPLMMVLLLLGSLEGRIRALEDRQAAVERARMVGIARGGNGGRGGSPGSRWRWW